MILQITDAIGGRRVDAFLGAEMPELSRSAAQKLIDEGRVTLGDKPVKKNYKTLPGDVLCVDLPEVESVGLQAQDIPLDVVYEDDDVIVINKPKGMVVHPAPGHPDGTLVNALMAHCGDSLSGINGELRPGIVHRIDKETSGLLISAKNDTAHRALAEQLKTHTLSRVYEAIVCGSIKQDAGTINVPIGRHPTDRKKQSVVTNTPRDAVTHYEVIARYNGYTHVRCRLETGRTHQIRVHMAHTGHPVAGDIVYGRKKPELGLDGQCLHARELSFIHPRTGETVTVKSELPEYFTSALSKLRKIT